LRHNGAPKSPKGDFNRAKFIKYASI
jgi:hypothetical protein